MSSRKIFKKDKPFHHCSTFYRKVKRRLDNINRNGGKQGIIDTAISQEQILICGSINKNENNENVEKEFLNPECIYDGSESTQLFGNNVNVENEADDIEKIIKETDDDDFEYDNTLTFNRELLLLEELRMWALRFNISHLAVNDLLHIFRTVLEQNVPKDTRTLLRTPNLVKIVPMGLPNKGSYWHNGLKNCLKLIFAGLKKSINISLIFNTDGLPIAKSSKTEFWPILFRIVDRKIAPMVIGIYCGENKPPLEIFLNPFVSELNDLLEHGLEVNSHMITVAVKCFVCDTLARCFIKGTVNFNAYHGCMRCTTIGEYSQLRRKISFPRTDCPLRTDASFRSQLDYEHNKETTPLIKLPIDLVSDVIIADSLHLIDLGVMRKCLYMWVDEYSKYLQVAEPMLLQYIELYMLLYGKESIGSNVHNLCHLVDDVKKFGPLPEISAYPVENYLGQIKNYLRQGNRPLAQIAKRITEISKLPNCEEAQSVYPLLSKKCSTLHELAPICTVVYKQIHVNEDFMLANNNKNKWFMTKQNDIVEMKNATYLNNDMDLL